MGPCRLSASAARSSRRLCRGTGGGGGTAGACRSVRASGSTSATASRKSASRGDLVIEILLRVECGHAAAACARDGLPVDVVLDIASGEDAPHAGFGGAAVAAAARD